MKGETDIAIIQHVLRITLLLLWPETASRPTTSVSILKLHFITTAAFILFPP
jgi:hypothetical protein